MTPTISGLHHVTAIAGDPQRNLDFYVGVLGLRLVKRTINFDDPGSYHFYFGDAHGTPGTILTFFPWPGARRGARGTGEVAATAFVIPLGYSNAANIAGGILLLRSGVLCGAALLRPMVPLIPKTLPELKATPVLVSAGNHDPIVPAENARELVALLRRAGADVTVCFENAGHGLTDTTFASTQRWLAEKAT